MKIIIFDFEVFKKDALLGAYILEDNKEPVLFQTWDKNEIKKFYYDNYESLWVGHNNEYYDNIILEAIITDKDVKKVNDYLIQHNDAYHILSIPLIYYDLMKFHMGSLKAIEAFEGENISETEVDFDLDRELTLDEKLLTEGYNRDDLNQTLKDFYYLLDGEISLRLDLIKEFDLELNDISRTEAQLAAKVLGATKIYDIESRPVEPKLYDNLKVNNKDVINFYMNKEYKTNKQLILYFGPTKHVMAAGGMHGALEKVNFKRAYYFDVSGYYNLIMILYNLLPRSIPSSGKKLYEYMYHEQIKLKKTDPRKRAVYKIILLAVFGAQNNKGSAFYDPYQGDLVRMTGQMFLVDLLEKISPLSTIIQSNTDGIIAYPNEGVKEEDFLAIIKEWMDRTGFTLKLDKIYNIWQRDVNNYCYQDDKGSIHTKGEALKYYNQIKTPFESEAYRAKEPLIISYALVEYLMNGVAVEETIEKYKNNLKMFQYICKKNSFDWLEIEETNTETGEIKTTILQKVNRAFARKDDGVKGVIYKRKHAGKTTKAKYQNTPPNVFVFNENINDKQNIDRLINEIDYDYYTLRTYERLWDFIGTGEKIK